MNISRFTVHRPVLTLMVTLIVILIGFTAFIRLPIDLMPDITYPTLTITTTYGNTSPEVMELLVTRPIEQALSALPGVEEISSTSSEGQSSVRLSFSWGTDLDAVTSDVRDRLDRIMNRLPSDIDRPRIFKFDAAAFPILFLGVSGDIDQVYLRELLEDQIAARLERVPGVASVDIWGGVLTQIEVQVFPEQLKALGIPLDQVVSRVTAGNVEAPVGTLYRNTFQIPLRAAGNYRSLEDIRNVVVATRSSGSVRVGQIARVVETPIRQTRIARIDGKPGIRMAVSKQSGKNTVEVAKGVLAEVKRINEDFPQIKVAVLTDTSRYIQYAIGNVGSSAIYGGLIALVILLFFLRNLGSSLIIAVAIPISIIATFALMYFNRFTLNIMSLGGLALGVGMLVDNSIVVLENIYRLRESGDPPIQAAVNGSGEVTAAIIASTLTTLVVFLPLLFVQGVSGVMYKQLALVVTFSLLCSMISALTLVPMLAARLVHPAPVDENGSRKNVLQKLFGWIGKLLHSMERKYMEILRRALNHPILIVFISIVLLGASFLLIPFIGSELMPASDQGQVRVNMDLEIGTRLEVTEEVVKKYIEPVVFKEVPEAESVLSSVGGGGFSGTSSRSAQVMINLKPISERSRSDEQIATDLRRKLTNIPGATIRVRTGQMQFLRGIGSSSGERLSIEIQGYDLSTADLLAKKVQSVVEKINGVTDTVLSRESGAPEGHFMVDREKLADLNVTVSAVSNTLKTAFMGTTAGTFRRGGREYNIVVKLANSEYLSPTEIMDLTVTNGAGVPVPIGSIVRMEPTTGPQRIERRNQQRVITVNVNISDRDLGSVAADVREAIQTIPLPRDFNIQLIGDYEEQQKSFRELLLSVALALLLVYMVMASLYESFKDPFIIMFSVPLAAIGVLLMLFLTRTTFNVQTGIGALMLGGIVVNNAIILVDHINLLRNRDKFPLRDAIEEAGRRRLRPILMTASTTMFALIPLALGLGEGGELQAPLARTVIGGLLSSTLITLVLIPCVYFLVEHHREKRKAS
ncbi:MAG: efflux RND transporter permease subunit [Spirochaetes bacterium]|nr:efflux RND transporter permease subunit [Spirochaetota bacterium]